MKGNHQEEELQLVLGESQKRKPEKRKSIAISPLFDLALKRVGVSLCLGVLKKVLL